MAIKIYSNYEEFRCEQEEISQFFEDESFRGTDYDLDDDFQIIEEMSGSKPSIREDASFYIVCSDDEEEVTDELIEILGESIKVYLDEFHKIFYYIS
jgi:hypothetical protein